MKKSILRKACENHFGNLDVNPGEGMNTRLVMASDSTIRSYIKKGWLARSTGGVLYLTKAGYLAV